MNGRLQAKPAAARPGRQKQSARAAAQAAPGQVAPPTRRDAAKEARRIQLIKATINSIATRGFADTTLADVAEGAGLSRGIVNFYFKSKEQLLADTLRFLADEYRRIWKKALDAAGPSAAARLRAIVFANYHPDVFSRKKLSVWYAFWGESKARPSYREICGDADDELNQVMAELVSEIIVEEGYTHIATASAVEILNALTDGFWQDKLMSGEGGARKTYDHDTDLTLTLLFPRHFGNAPTTGEPKS